MRDIAIIINRIGVCGPAALNSSCTLLAVDLAKSRTPTEPEAVLAAILASAIFWSLSCVCEHSGYIFAPYGDGRRDTQCASIAERSASRI